MAQELNLALQTMQDQKVLDMVGVSVEFYKAFRDILSQDILEVFSEGLATSSLPLSCRRVVTLLNVASCGELWRGPVQQDPGGVCHCQLTMKCFTICFIMFVIINKSVPLSQWSVL